MNVFLFLILWWVFFGNNTDKVEASTLARNIGDQISCEYTVNSDTTDITPGANLNVTSWGCYVITCGNEITIDFYMWSTSIAYATPIPENYDYGAAWISQYFSNSEDDSVTYTTWVPSARNITAALTTWTYKIPIKFDYQHYNGWRRSPRDNSGIGPFGCDYDHYDSHDSIPYACSNNYYSTKTSMVTRPWLCRWEANTACAWFKITAKDYFTYNVVNPQPPTCTLSYSPSTVIVGATMNWTLSSTNADSAKADCSPRWEAIVLSPTCGAWPCQTSGTWSIDTSRAVIMDCETKVTNSVGTETCKSSYQVIDQPPVCWTANWYTFLETDLSWWSKTLCAFWSGSATSFPSVWGTSNWTCNLDWKSTPCSASKSWPPSSPTCWTANNNTYLYSDNWWLWKTFCSVWINPVPSDPISPAVGSSTSWTCWTANCIAYKSNPPPLTGACWTANWYYYAWTDSWWLWRTFCSLWSSIVWNTPSFPDWWDSVTWKCQNWIDIANCSASRFPEEPPPPPPPQCSCYYISNWVPKWTYCDVFQKNICSETCKQENKWKAIRTLASWGCHRESASWDGPPSWSYSWLVQEWSCPANVAKPANVFVDKIINIADCPAPPPPGWECWDWIPQYLWNSNWLKEDCDDGNKENNDTCTNNCTDPHTSQPWEWSIIWNATCDLSDDWYANNSDINAIYATITVQTEDNKDAVNLGTPSNFEDLSNNKIDRVDWGGASSLTFIPVTTNITIRWDWTPQKVKIADVTSKTPFVSCNNEVRFNLWWQNMVLGNIWYNFKKPYVWELKASVDDWYTWDAKPSIWTITRYKLSALNNYTSISPNYIISLLSTDILHKWENIELQNTSLVSYSWHWPYEFESRINSSSSATSLNQQPWLQLNLPTISYTLGGSDVKYYLSKYEYGNDMTPIDMEWEPFLWVKIIWGLQWAWKYEFTGQWKNISDISISDIRTEIRKRAYDYTKNMDSWKILNKVRYEVWDVTLTGEIPDIDLDNQPDYETLVVKDGNVIIEWNYNTSGKKLWIIVLKDNYNVSTWYNGKWNIFVIPEVTSINAIMYADWWIMSANTSWNLYTIDSITRTNALQKQLKIKWSLFTRNTIWWAQFGWTTNWWVYILPGWTKTDDFDKAMIYDLNYIRRWNDWCIDNNVDLDCFDSGEIKEWLIIEYDSKIQTDPPKLFYK